MFYIGRQRREFNDDLDSYLNQRRGGSQSFFKRVESLIPKFSSSEKSDKSEVVSSKKPNVFEDDDDVPKKRKSFFWFLFSSSKKPSYDEDELDEIEHVEDELEQIDAREKVHPEDIEELEEKRESLLQRLFSFLSGRNKIEEEYESEYAGEDVPVQDSAASIREQETRATLKIMHKWIGRLSPEQIDAFKRSPDFQKYKDLLEMYNLIK